MTLQGSFDHILWLSIALARGAAAFLLLPLLSPQTMPPLVRNSILLGFGMIVLFMQPQSAILGAGGGVWLALLCREIFIGLIIGFFFGGVIWSFEIAGEYIDMKIGPVHAEIADPFSGQQTSVFSIFYSRFANFIFVSCGGLLYLSNTLLKSYVIWPIAAAAPSLHLDKSEVFGGSLQQIMAMALGIAIPVLLVLTMVEAAAGLLNRFSPELNVFSASLSVKNWVAGWIVILTTGILIQTLSNDIAGKMDFVLHLLSEFR